MFIPKLDNVETATLVPHPELLLSAVLERPLVVQDELLAVFGLQGNEYDFV